MPHQGDAGDGSLLAEEKAYLLAAYNRYFARPGGPATETDVVFTWSGVRALQDDASGRSRAAISRSPALSCITNGTGGFVTLYGGKLTTHRALAETVLDAAARRSAPRSEAPGPRTCRSMADASRAPSFSPAPREARKPFA